MRDGGHDSGDPKDSSLKYDHMVEDALRSVVGRALRHAIGHGLSGDHHFYITFRTDDPGTEISPRLRERYPKEMTIVLQHQFWDLAVTDEGFSVGLSFDDIRETLIVPFPALVSFADPSVQFGLQFEIREDERPAGKSGPEPLDADAGPDDTAKEPGEEPGEDKQTQDPNKVVNFEAFRRKQT